MSSPPRRMRRNGTDNNRRSHILADDDCIESWRFVTDVGCSICRTCSARASARVALGACRRRRLARDPLISKGFAHVQRARRARVRPRSEPAKTVVDGILSLRRKNIMGRGGPNIGKRPDKVVRENAPYPEEPLGAEATIPGSVKWWDSGRGYGAISTETTAPWDIWCHFSHVAGSGYIELIPGEPVTAPEAEGWRSGRDTAQAVKTRRSARTIGLLTASGLRAARAPTRGSAGHPRTSDGSSAPARSAGSPPPSC